MLLAANASALSDAAGAAEGLSEGSSLARRHLRSSGSSAGTGGAYALPEGYVGSLYVTFALLLGQSADRAKDLVQLALS